jgi:hypothetical protein
VLDALGRGEIPLSIELAGGPERVLTLAAFDAADTGIRIHVDGPGANLVATTSTMTGRARSIARSPFPPTFLPSTSTLSPPLPSGPR